MRAALFAVVVSLVGASTAHAQDAAEPKPKPKPWLGVSIADGAGSWGGVAIVDVFEGTPAALCGIQAGDEIFSINRVEVHGFKELQVAITAHDVGDKVRVEYLRGDALRRCTVRLAEQITDPSELLQRRVVDRAIQPFALERRSDGELLDDVSTRGDVLVLALISTACEACIATLTELEAAVGGSGAELLVVTDDGDVAADAFVQRTGVTVELALERRSTAAPYGLVHRYLVDRDDATILIVDHEGKVTFAAVGQGVEAANLDGAAFCAERAERARRKAR